jgi:hypothetical protein
MKKAFLLAAACFTLATSSIFAGGSAPTLSFTGPTNWVPGTSITLSVNLTFSGFNAFGLSYYIETNNALAPFLSITDLQHFTFPHGATLTVPILFHPGANGFATEDTDLGGGISDPTTEPPVPPGSYHVTDITFFLAAGAPVGMYVIRSSTTNPHASIVSDTKFNDHAIPQSTFAFNVVPEPNTVVLLGLGIVGGSLFFNRRRKQSL